MYDEIIDAVIEKEGRTFTNRPNDRGGPTKFGITQRTLSAYLGRQASIEEVKNLTEPDARRIYTDLFIERPRFDEIEDADLQLVIIDIGVHSGPPRAARFLQKELGLKADGIVGPITLGAANHPDLDVEQFINAVTIRRINFLGRLISKDHRQAENAGGWLRRATSFFIT